MTRSARLQWTDDEGTHVYPLARPLMRMAPRARRREWRFEANSGAIHTEKAAVTVQDVEGVIRFADRPQLLLEAISERLGRSITYVEDQGAGDVELPATLVSVDTADQVSVALDPDPARYSHGEYSIRVRLRMDDPADAAILYGYTGG